jgi:hypothetical protein
LEYRGPAVTDIHRTERRGEILFYIPPLQPWHDSVFWICFLLGCALSTWVFIEPLLEAFDDDDSRTAALASLLLVSWGLCAWLSFKASVRMHPHWRISLTPSRLTFRSRAAWKAMEGAWDRNAITELFVETSAEWVEFGLRLQDGTRFGLVIVQGAFSPRLIELANEVSRHMDLPVGVRVQCPELAR